MAAYLVTGCWRLARYNLTGLQGSGQSEHFTGVPTTIVASAFFILQVILHRAQPHVEPAASFQRVRFAATALFFALSAGLMVSRVKFPKHGWLVRSLHVLLPGALLILWWPMEE
jgi:phosphatidylserine synthase